MFVGGFDPMLRVYKTSEGNLLHKLNRMQRVGGEGLSFFTSVLFYSLKHVAAVRVDVEIVNNDGRPQIIRVLGDPCQPGLRPFPLGQCPKRSKEGEQNNPGKRFSRSM